MAGFGSSEGESIRFERSQAALLDALLAAQPAITYDETFAKLREELNTFSGVAPADPPSSFQGTLREYQREALGWFEFLRKFNFGGCLADDMGLGKTVMVLALLESRRQALTRTRTLPPLGVVPPLADQTCLAGPVAIGDSTFTVVADNAPAVTATVANTKLPYTNLVVEMTPAPADVEPEHLGAPPPQVTDDGADVGLAAGDLEAHDRLEQDRTGIDRRRLERQGAGDGERQLAGVVGVGRAVEQVVGVPVSSH